MTHLFEQRHTHLFSALYHKTFFFLCLCMVLFSQSHLAHAHQPIRVFEMASSSQHDVLFSYHEGKVFFGAENKTERMIYRFKGNKLYRTLFNGVKFKETCLYTFTKHRLFRGNSTKQEDCLFTFYDGKIYNGYAPTPQNILYRFDGQKIFRGNSNQEKDILYTFKKQQIFRGSQTKNRLYSFQAKKDDWYRVYYTSSKQAVFTMTRLSSESSRYPCSRMKYIRMLGLIDFLSLGLIDSPWSMIYFAMQMNDAVYQCID
ncbi:MAG: hypothetical protein Q9M28_05590 [Mariprofundaceae bacterium]|nr:hypothetical protein [Mariprofundaceae bacterium]